MKIKTAAAAVLAWAAMSGVAAAQDPQRLAIAQEIMVLMEVDETVNSVFEDLTPLLSAGIGQELRLSSAEQSRLGELLAEELRAESPALIATMAQSYANNLSMEHLTQIRAFMQSDAGRAMVDGQGVVQQELERSAEAMGMRVALRALTRFQAERDARR